MNANQPLERWSKKSIQHALEMGCDEYTESELREELARREAQGHREHCRRNEELGPLFGPRAVEDYGETN